MSLSQITTVKEWVYAAFVIKQQKTSVSAATSLQDLRELKGNRLEALKGDRAGQYSIRINDQYRVCFQWEKETASDVEIVDYHS